MMGLAVVATALVAVWVLSALLGCLLARGEALEDRGARRKARLLRGTLEGPND